MPDPQKTRWKYGKNRTNWTLLWTYGKGQIFLCKIHLFMSRCCSDLLYFLSSTDWPQHIPQLIAQSIRNFFQSHKKYIESLRQECCFCVDLLIQPNISSNSREILKGIREEIPVEVTSYNWVINEFQSKVQFLISLIIIEIKIWSYFPFGQFSTKPSKNVYKALVSNFACADGKNVKFFVRKCELFWVGN